MLYPQPREYRQLQTHYRGTTVNFNLIPAVIPRYYRKYRYRVTLWVAAGQRGGHLRQNPTVPLIQSTAIRNQTRVAVLS